MDKGIENESGNESMAGRMINRDRVSTQKGLVQGFLGEDR